MLRDDVLDGDAIGSDAHRTEAPQGALAGEMGYCTYIWWAFLCVNTEAAHLATNNV